MTSIGIDVGGLRSGYHAVALHSDSSPTRFATRDPLEMADWCRSLNASVIAVDAPCLWAVEGKSRLAERQIYAHKIHSYYTPTADIAVGRGFYDWVRNGMRLYSELTKIYPLYNTAAPASAPCVFETFPHAVTCALMGRVVSAKNKRGDRELILANAGINFSTRVSQDTLDAALCALTARHYAQGSVTAYGEDSSGWIIVPASSTGQEPAM